MNFQNILNEVQSILAKRDLDGWLLADDHGHNTLAYTFLQIPLGKMTTRRFFYWIPVSGDPVKIIPKIEPYTLDHIPGTKVLYRSWEEMGLALDSILQGKRQIAMEYSPRHALPNVSKVDAGLVDLIRSFGVKITSSADLLQKYTSVLTDAQIETHRQAAQILSAIVKAVWDHIRKGLETDEPMTEYTIQQFMLNQMSQQGCVTADPPICAVNAHSADPHYALNETGAFSIKKGDLILLDLWCKLDQPQAIYADITRMGIIQANPTPKQKAVFAIVQAAQEAATHFIANRFAAKESVQGWEVDQVCRDVIDKAGYGQFFIHRTGHSIGCEVHSSGANLDNLETHDVRNILPGTCFSIEPGIYLPGEFGIRLEYDVCVDLNSQVTVTGGIQKEIYQI
jgi:Xaa-Pro dipeptidase